MESNEVIKFKERFLAIKSQGFVKSRRIHDTGIGKTFEDLMGIDENNNPIPDFLGMEIKTQRQFSSSYVTLTTKSPDYPRGANAFLKDVYGYPDPEFPSRLILHTSMFHDRFNTCKGSWGFKLDVDRTKEKIFIRVLNYKNNKIEENDVYYKFQTLDNIIKTKLTKVAYVTAKSRKTSSGEEFHFTRVILLTDFSLEKFIKLIEDSYIMYDIRIGVYRSGKNVGRPHDHGSGFRIHRNNLDKAFSITVIE